MPGSNFMNETPIATKAPYGTAPKVPGLDELSSSSHMFVRSRTYDGCYIFLMKPSHLPMQVNDYLSRYIGLL